MSRWQIFKEAINSIPLEKIFDRKTLIQKVGIDNITTTDMYFRLICRLGIAEKVSRGKYIIHRKIPQDFNTITAYKILTIFDQPWHKWFVTLEDKIEIAKKQL